jgi:hypothetical protein
MSNTGQGTEGNQSLSQGHKAYDLVVDLKLKMAKTVMMGILY